jgi:hypothetical protein
MKGKTESGFEFEINESNLDDMRFIDALANLDAGNPIAISQLANIMFSQEQKKLLYQHLAERDKEGKVRIEPFIKEITDILTYKEDTKN